MGSVISACSGYLPHLAGFIPPTPEAYGVLLNGFQYFPLVTLFQWLLSFHPAGKTSMKDSYLNLPGRFGWFLMEIIGPVNLIYLLYQMPSTFDIQIPLTNKLVASLYVIHYIHRAIISPFFLAPSMSPIHVFIASSAMLFNWVNSSCLAGWLAGYRVPVVGYQTDGGPFQRALGYLPYIGVGLFCIGMAGNIYSERAIFHLRREEADKRMAKKDKDVTTEPKNKYFKVYVIPPTQGVFKYILYPHYAFEWLEWTGFALIGTAVISSPHSPSTPPLTLAPWLLPSAFLSDKFKMVLPLPALVFVVNAVANMLPHARWGRKWYVEKFGERAVAGRGAAVPGCSWL